MVHIEANTCDEAWRQAAQLVRQNGLEQESRTFRSQATTETLELLHASMTITDPRQRIVFARPINPAFAIAECIWILAGSDDLEFIKFWNPLMTKFSDDGITLRGAYGWRLGCNANSEMGNVNTGYFVSGVFNKLSQLEFNQLTSAYDALMNVQHTRQVVLQIWDGTSDFPFKGEPRSKDIPCNLISHLLVRDNKLHWLQIMRSNDLMWGTPYNFIQWTTLQEIMAGWLGLEVGQYTHIASSLHVYQEHWEELKALALTDWVDNGEWSMPGIKKVVLRNTPQNQADLRINTYEEWLPVFKVVRNAAINFTRAQSIDDVNDILVSTYNQVTPAYREWLAILGAEVCRKLGDITHARYTAADAGKYYQTSWLQWLERKQNE